MPSLGHYGMQASRNNRGEANENGAVESQNRHLKLAIRQALILRGSRDFVSADDYWGFIDLAVVRRNRQRADAIQAERAHLKPLPQRRTTDFTEMVVPVTRTVLPGQKHPLQRDLPRRDACRRMVDLLFIAHEQACEADLDAGRLPDTEALTSQLASRRMELPSDVAVAHPSLGSFNAHLGASAWYPATSTSTRCRAC